MKKKKIRISHALATGLVFSGLLACVVFYKTMGVHLVNSLFGLGSALVSYALSIAGIDCGDPPMPLDLSGIQAIEVYLPISSNSDAAFQWLIASLKVTINGDYLRSWLSNLVGWFSLLARFAMILIPVIILLKISFGNYAKPRGMALAHRTRALRFADKANSAVFLPLLGWIKGLLGFWREAGWGRLFLAILFYLAGGVSICLDLFSYYLVLCMDITHPLIILEALSNTACIAWPFLAAIGPVGVLIIVYLVFDFVRRRAGKKKLYKLKEKNKEAIRDNLGVTCILNGAPGTGKGLTNNSICRLKEEIIREDMRKVIDKFGRAFPGYDWTTHYSLLAAEIKAGRVINTAQVEKWAREVPKAAGWLNYDQRLGMTWYDGKRNYTLEDAVAEASKAWATYATEKPIILSNYGMCATWKSMGEATTKMIDFKTLERDYRKASEFTQFSTIVDLNAFRLNTPVSVGHDGKIKELDPEKVGITWQVMPLVLSLQEINKEYPNKNTPGVQDRNLDGFRNFVSLARHFTTIDHNPQFLIVADLQRTSDIPAGLLQMFETELVISERDRKPKSALLGWTVGRWASEWFIEKANAWLARYRSNNDDERLLTTIVSWITHQVMTRYERNRSEFDYIREKLINIHHTGDSQSSAGWTYFIIPKDDYAEKYATDNLAGDIKSHQIGAGESVFTRPQWTGLYITPEDRVAMNTYSLARYKNERKAKKQQDGKDDPKPRDPTDRGIA